MRLLSANLQGVMSHKTKAYFYMLSLGTGAAPTPPVILPLRLTTHISDITVAGLVYKANGRIIGVDTMRLGSTVDRDQFKVSITDIDFATGILLDGAGLTGVELGVYLGFLDPTGAPFTDANDIVTVYKGIIDGYGYSIDTANKGSVALTLTGSSPMANLDQKRFVELSKQAARARNSGDSCCDSIYEGSSALTLEWGKGQ